MFKNIIALVALVAVTLSINPKPAQAAIADCASQGCFPVCTDAGPVKMYFKSDGSHAGTINGVGTGNCRVFADEGYLIITRPGADTTVRIYNVQSESLCSLDTGASMPYGLVFGSYAYVTASGGLVKKINLDCSGSQNITVGSSPNGITKDSNTIYVVNTASSNISTIVPPAVTSTTYGIGRVGGDGLQAVKYHSGTNALYISGLAGVYKADLPLGTSALWQPISGGSTLDMNSTHVVVPSMSGNLAYFIDIANPTTDATVSCTACRSVAINDSTFYTIGGNVPDVGAKAWDFSLNQESYSPVTPENSQWVAYLAPTVAAPVCPNGIKEAGEACDGTQFGAATCQTLGFDSGSLSCSGTCTIDTTGCTMNCGNGSIDINEDCDGANLNGQSCTDLGFDSGTLSCNASCEFVTTSCVTLTCNNGSIDSGEDCDGANLNGSTCQSLGFTGGSLSCSPTSCEFVTTSCVSDTCGDGILDMGEQCDTNNFGGETCQTQGFDGGTLSCESCTLNTTGCTMISCGNGVINNGEECDDDNTTAGDGCSGNCQIEEGYICEGEPSECTLINTCNQDGLVEVLDSISHPDLTGAALAQYQISSALPKGSTITCESVMGVDVIKVQVPAGHHANVRIQTSTMEVVWHLYDGATLLVPVANPSLMNRIGGGDIFLHSGSDIEAKYESLGLGTLGTAGMNRFLSANPLTGTSGNWLEIRVTTDRVRLFALEDAGNTVTLVASEMNSSIYVNLDALGDLSEIFQPPTKKDPGCGGCSTSNNGSSSIPVGLVIVLVFSMIRRRKVSGSR